MYCWEINQLIFMKINRWSELNIKVSVNWEELVSLSFRWKCLNKTANKASTDELTFQHVVVQRSSVMIEPWHKENVQVVTPCDTVLLSRLHTLTLGSGSCWGDLQLLNTLSSAWNSVSTARHELTLHVHMNRCWNLLAQLVRRCAAVLSTVARRDAGYDPDWSRRHNLFVVFVPRVLAHRWVRSTSAQQSYRGAFQYQPIRVDNNYGVLWRNWK